MKNKLQGSFVILSQPADVSAFLEDVRQAADSERDSLGFYAASVYREYALKGNLFVAVDADQGQRRYAGHLLFDLRQPRAKVLQVFVSPIYRGQHLASRLVEGLKAHLTNLQYMSIEARVAEDMKSSNAFWESQGFYAQRVVPGGASRGKRRRMIVARSHELASPQLFSSSGINGANPFGLSFVSGNEKPTYLLDMNVLFDLGPRRHRRDDVINLFRAERMQACSLAISSEIQVELKRSASPGKTDPMQDFASILPTYATPNVDETGELMQALSEIVFPERSNGHLTSNDKSDLRHLLTAITHGLQGLVTSDAAILNAASSLKTRHQIDVLSPAAFSLPETYPIDTSQLYQQRHYISHHKTLSVFAAGSLMFFYESQKDGGLGAIIAIGRVVRSYLQNVESIGRADLDASVLERDQLSSIGKTDSRTITVFDNLTVLSKPVERATLLQLGCGTPVKLLSAQKINTEQVQGILAKAYSS